MVTYRIRKPGPGICPAVTGLMHSGTNDLVGLSHRSHRPDAYRPAARLIRARVSGVARGASARSRAMYAARRSSAGHRATSGEYLRYLLPLFVG